jgi:hypothetical protein
LDLYVEFLGLRGEPNYDLAWEAKKRLYEEHNVKFVALDENDLRDLDVAIPRKIPELRAIGPLR